MPARWAALTSDPGVVYRRCFKQKEREGRGVGGPRGGSGLALWVHTRAVARRAPAPAWRRLCCPEQEQAWRTRTETGQLPRGAELGPRPSKCHPESEARCPGAHGSASPLPLTSRVTWSLPHSASVYSSVSWGDSICYEGCRGRELLANGDVSGGLSQAVVAVGGWRVVGGDAGYFQ